jgi:hypothetical protein
MFKTIFINKNYAYNLIVIAFMKFGKGIVKRNQLFHSQAYILSVIK